MDDLYLQKWCLGESSRRDIPVRPPVPDEDYHPGRVLFMPRVAADDAGRHGCFDKTNEGREFADLQR